MADYISREAVLKAFKLIAKNPNKDYQRGMQDTIDCLVPEVIADIPAADVQPLKCGTWERDGANHHRCSVCKNFLSSNVHVKLYNFCPNCGAKLKNRYCPLTTYPTNCKDNCTECIYAENVKEEVQMAIGSGDNRYER